MNSNVVDEAIEKYIDLRLKKGKNDAAERLLSYAYLKYRGDELIEFLRRINGLSRYYADFCAVMKNPLKGPEFAWFASMLAIALFSCLLMGVEEYRFYGIAIFIAIVANVYSLLKAVQKKYVELGIRGAIYYEIMELAEHEVRQVA